MKPVYKFALIWNAIALIYWLAIFPGCSTLTTPLRDCKAMCAGKVEFFQSQSEGNDQHCVCS